MKETAPYEITAGHMKSQTSQKNRSRKITSDFPLVPTGDPSSVTKAPDLPWPGGPARSTVRGLQRVRLRCDLQGGRGAAWRTDMLHILCIHFRASVPPKAWLALALSTACSDCKSSRRSVPKASESSKGMASQIILNLLDAS